jgi:hypothetical protein
MRLLRSLLDRARGPKWVPLDFLLYIWYLRPDNDGADPLPDGKRDSLSWYALQQVIYIRKPYPLLAWNATECCFRGTSQSADVLCSYMTAETVLFVDAISRLQGQTHASKLLLYILLQPVAYERYMSVYMISFLTSIETADWAISSNNWLLCFPPAGTRGELCIFLTRFIRVFRVSSRTLQTQN